MIIIPLVYQYPHYHYGQQRGEGSGQRRIVGFAVQSSQNKICGLVGDVTTGTGGARECPGAADETTR